MTQKIDADHARFRHIVRGKIKENLKKFITKGEILGKKGKDVVSIPLPQIQIPRFQYGHKETGGTGQGDGEVGDVLAPGDVEGQGTGEWVLVDAGDAVVHIMQPSIRDYYNLEEIWGGKQVHLKTTATSTTNEQ